MALYLTEADVRSVLTMREALPAVEEAFLAWGQGKATNQPRRRIRVPEGRLHVMAAAQQGGGLGLKTYAGVAGRNRVLVVLYSCDTGELLAILEAAYLGMVRTGAASGVATKHMAREDAAEVGLLGAGYQAAAQVEAVCAVRPIKQVKVFSRNPERRSAAVQVMKQSLAVPLRPVESAREAVEGSDIVIAITNSAEPVLSGEWLRAGTHVNAAGSNDWLRRELDELAVARSGRIIVDDLEQAKQECGELIWAVERGVIRWEQVRELRDVVAGNLLGRGNTGEITLFESQGLALEDMAVAMRAYELAKQLGLGLKLPG